MHPDGVKARVGRWLGYRNGVEAHHQGRCASHASRNRLDEGSGFRRAPSWSSTIRKSITALEQRHVLDLIWNDLSNQRARREI
jgi:hypothetical protein